ncbi:MAG: response regulator transcription factor, partial [Desulfobacterales bacterium]
MLSWRDVPSFSTVDDCYPNALTIMASDRENSTILLVDDHPLMRKGLRALLEGEPDLAVAGEAGDGEEAIEQARALAPDIVVMDVSMPRLNGI